MLIIGSAISFLETWCFFVFFGFFYSAIILSLPLIQVGQMSVTDDIPVIFGIAKDSLNYLLGSA